MALSTPEQQPAEPRRGRVRFKRSAVLLVPSVAAAATLAVFTAQGALATQFAISGIPFEIHADSLVGDGFEQFGSLDNKSDQNPTDPGGQQLVMVSAVRSATLTNLCQSIDLGPIYMVLTAGQGPKDSDKVHADTLVADSEDIKGNATFDNINIGQDGGTMDQVPGVTTGFGNFGQQATHVKMIDFYQKNYATSAVKFTLPGLHMRFSDHGCPQ